MPEAISLHEIQNQEAAENDKTKHLTTGTEVSGQGEKI